MATNKATNDGTCQICFRRQRLPNGQLAKHGYDVEYGFFNGVCVGAEQLPYELSRDLIPPVIERLKAEQARLEAWIADLRKPAIEPTAPWNAYIEGRNGRYGYERVTITFFVGAKVTIIRPICVWAQIHDGVGSCKWQGFYCIAHHGNGRLRDEEV